jgi:hypothetical protein
VVSAAFPYDKRRLRVLGSEMAYVEVGEGDPIVLLPERSRTGCLRPRGPRGMNRLDGFL